MMISIIGLGLIGASFAKAIKNVDTESANEIQTLLEKYNAVVKEYTAITIYKFVLLV